MGSEINIGKKIKDLVEKRGISIGFVKDGASCLVFEKRPLHKILCSLPKALCAEKQFITKSGYTFAAIN